jgi:uncharacterized oligopeptide transporter (OPT) family protein
MHQPEPQVSNKLPENAYRELKPGEAYVPMVPPGVRVPEVTLRSIIFGIVMNVIFSMAATFVALKVGQGIETAIPISILAVGLSGFLLNLGLRRSTIIENVNILAISTTSGIVAGGTVFTMPAIYVLKLNETMSPTVLFMLIFLVPFFGAVLGVLFLVPFRRYFVKEMHGKLPFPEATATNEILVTGQGGSESHAIVLVYSFIIGFLYNCVSGVFHLFTETFTTAAVPAFTKLTTQVKAVFSLGTGAEFLGLGFIIGVRYASIIVAGSLLSWFVIIPLLAPLGIDAIQYLNPEARATGAREEAPLFIAPAALAEELPAGGDAEPTPMQVPEGLRAAFAARGERLSNAATVIPARGGGWTLADPDRRRTYLLETAAGEPELHAYGFQTTANDLFRPIPRNIGIGCIFTAGIISILKMGGVIVTALRQAMRVLFKSSGASTAVDRTDEDISYPVLIGLGVLTAAAIFAYFRFVVMADLPNATSLAAISLVLALVVAFLFTTVSAWAIATISVTPISGMTVTTIIVTAVVLLNTGLPTGGPGMLIVLLVGGVVASALSMAGTLVTEFKIGYWTGATPKHIQWSAILASVLASALVTITIMILAKTFGYDAEVKPGALAAPQANMMASALKSFIGGGSVPWLMYGVGVVIAVLMNLLGISPLAFGLGMYLPMELNAPILVGAIVASLVNKSSKDERVVKGRSDKGILIASGLIAGAAILGVGKSLVASFPFSEGLLEVVNFGDKLEFEGSPSANWLGLILFLALCVFVYWDCRTAKPAETAGGPGGHGH